MDYVFITKEHIPPKGNQPLVWAKRIPCNSLILDVSPVNDVKIIGTPTNYYYSEQYQDITEEPIRSQRADEEYLQLYAEIAPYIYRYFSFGRAKDLDSVLRWTVNQVRRLTESEVSAWLQTMQFIEGGRLQQRLPAARSRFNNNVSLRCVH